MKAICMPEDESYRIELIAESQEERETLIRYWKNGRISVSCEEWREMSDDANNKNKSDAT
jgi:hypothetical protein